jgi:hypothetical protein
MRLVVRVTGFSSYTARTGPGSGYHHVPVKKLKNRGYCIPIPANDCVRQIKLFKVFFALMSASTTEGRAGSTLYQLAFIKSSLQ